MGMDVTTAAYHNSYDVAKKETKRAEDRGSAKTDNLQDLRDVLAVGKSVERTDLEKMMKKYDPEAYAEYSKLVQESQNTISFMSQWRTKMKKALQDGTIVSGRPKPPVRNVKGNVNVTISKEVRELFDGRVVKKSRPPHEAPNTEKQNATHFSNINDPNDHGFFTKIWDEDGNVVWDASWNNNVEPQKPEPGMPPHGAPSLGQLPHWTEISRDLAEHGFYKNMTRQEIDHLEGFLRSMRTADDLNAFADKHTSGNLRQYLKDLAKGYGSYDKGHSTPQEGLPPHGAPKSGQLPRWKEISRDLAEHGFYKNMTRQEVDYLEGFLRSMRSAKDLNIFADKYTSGDLREFLKELAKSYANNDRGRMR